MWSQNLLKTISESYRKEISLDISKNSDDVIMTKWNLISELIKESGFCHFNNFFVDLFLRVIIFANK